MSYFQFSKTDPQAKMPYRASQGDAGYDVCSLNEVILEYGKVAKIDTGLKVSHIPIGWEIQVRTRSGLASKGIRVSNSPGTIDSGYRGQIFVLLYCDESADGYVVRAGDKIAQLVMQQVEQTYIVDATDGGYKIVPQGTGDRGDAGFGSTGR